MMPGGLIRRVVFQPDSATGLQKGINMMADVVRQTLGPAPRTVAIERMSSRESAELLDDGGTITRRIIQFADRDADMGAMLVRHLLWRLHEQVGDGTSTAATLFQAVYNEGLRYTAAGGNPQQLRRYLEDGAQTIVDELDGLTTRVEGQAKLAHLAESICHDPELASLLGEIFDIVGEHGHVDIRRGNGRALERHYVEGMSWETTPFSLHMFDDQVKLRTDLQNVAILISDLEITEPRALAPVLDLAMTLEIRTLVVVASELSEHAIALLIQAGKEPEKFRVVAVKTPGLGSIEQAEAMEDLAVLTGGRMFLRAAGDALHHVKAADFGHARRAWATRSFFGVVAGKGDPRELRRHIGHVRSLLERTDDPHSQTRLQRRVGKLMGGSATLLLGSTTETENTVQEERARRTIAALRAALRDGVLLGGGRSLMRCRQKLLAQCEQHDDPDAISAYRILIKALEAPLRQIVANGGYDAAAVLADLQHAPPESGFDVRSGNIIDLAEAGIIDVAAAQKAAVYGAITAAAQALTIDVLIHSKKPKYAAAT
ncbi:MAG: chaperonin GroEL [Herpetosiphon sp.]